MSEYLAFARSLAKEGGKILSDHFGKLRQSQIHSKGPHDLVTELDKKIEEMYIKEIKNRFPTHGIIGEESGIKNEKAEYVWVLDPLDGTRNFTIEVPFYATTLCLLKNGEPIIGVIYVPPVDKLYSAVKGGGAFLNGKKIHVSDQKVLKNSSVLYCHTSDKRGVKTAEKYAAKLKLVSFSADRLRSAGGEMGLIAQGLAEAYLLDGLPLWDLAAGALLVCEAGGKATDFEGREWVPGYKNILLSNGTKIHGEILKILSVML